MIFGLLLRGVADYLAYIELNAIPKRKEKRKAIKLVTKKIKIGKPTNESVMLGSGSVGISLYDIYAAADNH